MTKYTNGYTPPPPAGHASTLSLKPEEYDFNFVFPVSLLRTDRVELRPFVPSLHAQLLYDGFKRHPETQEWLPMVTDSLQDVLDSTEARRVQPGFLQYAIYTDKPGSDTPQTDPSEYEFAGTISCINASADDLVAEVGWVVIFPKYQRTHVLSHSAGALIHHVLDMLQEGGLGLRRCQWFTTSLNVASQNAALRLGFIHEGVLRYHRTLLKGKKGARSKSIRSRISFEVRERVAVKASADSSDGRPGDAKPDQMSRDSWLASITCEEWENGARDRIDSLIARR